MRQKTKEDFWLKKHKLEDKWNPMNHTHTSATQTKEKANTKKIPRCKCETEVQLKTQGTEGYKGTHMN